MPSFILKFAPKIWNKADLIYDQTRSFYRRPAH
jgi:hypothetical protein